jgi:hypothetical protein
MMAVELLGYCLSMLQSGISAFSQSSGKDKGEGTGEGNKGRGGESLLFSRPIFNRWEILTFWQEREKRRVTRG